MKTATRTKSRRRRPTWRQIFMTAVRVEPRQVRARRLQADLRALVEFL